MPESAIRANFDEPLDVHRNVFAQIALDATFALDDLADAVDLFFVQVLYLLPRLDVRRLQNSSSARIANSVNVSERDIRVLVARKIDACNTCHDPSLETSRQPSAVSFQ